MLSGLYANTANSLRNPFLWRTTSHESVLHASPPKSFAEEVANELSNRARALGSSHPSVILGKQKRLMDGLMEVAESIRSGFPRTDKDTINLAASSKPLSLTSKAADVTKKIETKASGIVFENNRYADVKQCSSDLKSLDVLTLKSNPVKDSKEIVDNFGKEFKDKISGPTFYGDILEDTTPSPIHLRLAQDYSDSPSVKSNMKPPRDAVYSPVTPKRKAPSKPKRKQKTRISMCIANFFQSKMKKKKSKSEKKPKLRDRIIAFINNGTLRNVRKSIRSFWSPRKEASNKLTQMKTNVQRMSMI